MSLSASDRCLRKKDARKQGKEDKMKPNTSGCRKYGADGKVAGGRGTGMGKATKRHKRKEMTMREEQDKLELRSAVTYRREI